MGMKLEEKVYLEIKVENGVRNAYFYLEGDIWRFMSNKKKRILVLNNVGFNSINTIIFRFREVLKDKIAKIYAEFYGGKVLKIQHDDIEIVRNKYRLNYGIEILSAFKCIKHSLLKGKLDNISDLEDIDLKEVDVFEFEIGLDIHFRNKLIDMIKLTMVEVIKKAYLDASCSDFTNVEKLEILIHQLKKQYNLITDKDE